MPRAGLRPHAVVMTDDRSETLQAVAAQRIAGLLILGFGLCEEGRVPLSDRQKIAMLTSALLEFDGIQAEVHGLLQIERLLAEFRVDGSDGHSEAA
jgi:hypothetical protein